MADLFDTAAPAAGGPRGNQAASLAALRQEAVGCRLCPLWEPATQTVFGEGPPDAELMLVGEQPGDQEDLAGHPFVGPAGQLLNDCLAEAGIDRGRAYVTNAVKHFKFEPRGKRRIHQKPRAGEIDTCAAAWLAQERQVVSPTLTICLGASAARGLTGKTATIKALRGEVRDSEGGPFLVTVHPSYLLRLPDPGHAAAEREAFVADLVMGREWAEARA